VSEVTTDGGISISMLLLFFSAHGHKGAGLEITRSCKMTATTV